VDILAFADDLEVQVVLEKAENELLNGAIVEPVGLFLRV
jgi:hypothetical protein